MTYGSHKDRPRRTLRPARALAAVLALGLWAPPALAEGADAAGRAAEICRGEHGGGQLALVLCEAGADMHVWAEAGRAACGDHALCAAFVYDDPTRLPDPVPDAFDDLTEADVTAARAIWVHEDQNLILIDTAGDGEGN